jgi:hypothetical protein
LFDGPSFSFVRRTAFGHGLIDQIRNHEQTPAQMRASRQALIQTGFVLITVAG